MPQKIILGYYEIMAQETKLLNVYLAVGEDLLKRRRVLERLRKRLEDFGDISFNHDEFDGETAAGETIVSACNTLPFASEIRLVEVTNVDKLKKTDAEKLVGYLTSPCPSTILILSGDRLAKNTRLYKAVAGFGKTAIIDCAPMKRADLTVALRSMAVSHGFTITPNACEKLVELVGENTVHLDAELKKLGLAHQGNDPVTEHEVSSLVARVAEAKPWDFVDAFASRNTARCFHLIPLLKSTSPYALLAQCQTRIRELLCTKSLERNGSIGALAQTLNLQPWRVRNHRTWARNFTEEELVAALVSSRDAEKHMKSGQDPDRVFADWFSSVTIRH